ncbi:hypothetical protein E2C01_027961 [Portunus trituberculatus]|uniref:Uncharacterized protein n=1 Tax=Portunus trituberculatus TaxID=210409 RepID=A0A5B7EN21_PORTR|nr:hypothetical protein [Portunus trituberculatus]
MENHIDGAWLQKGGTLKVTFAVKAAVFGDVAMAGKQCVTTRVRVKHYTRAAAMNTDHWTYWRVIHGTGG